MPICQKCGAEFPNRVVVDGVVRVVNRRKHCLTCSPFGSRNTRRLGAAGDARGTYAVVTDAGRRVCTKCGIEKDPSEFYSYKSGRKHSWCKVCLKAGVIRRQRQFKVQAIEYKGGKCRDCGKMPHPAAMTFHHRDSDSKDFAIGEAHTRTLEAVKDELDKCDLLCSNCHRILHAGDDWEW